MRACHSSIALHCQGGLQWTAELGPVVWGMDRALKTLKEPKDGPGTAVHSCGACWWAGLLTTASKEDTLPWTRGCHKDAHPLFFVNYGIHSLMFCGYPPTAIGYTPTAIGYPPTAIIGRIGRSKFFFSPCRGQSANTLSEDISATHYQQVTHW